MRIGILGAARIARHAVVDPARRLTGFDLIAVAARDPARARAFADAHDIADAEPSYDALLARRDLDIVYVPLINVDHARWTVAALDAGHHVLCEKPLAMNAAQARMMVDAAHAAGKFLIEGFHYRHHTLMQWLITVIANRQLGHVRRVSGHFVTAHPVSDRSRWDAALGGGALLDLGCYPLHALRTLFGEPEVLRADALYFEGVDATLDADLAWGNLAGTIRCSFEAETRSAGLSIEGSEGTVVIDNFVAPQFRHRVVMTRRGREEVLSFEGPATYDAQLLHVRDVLAGVAPPVTGGADAIANMTAIDSIFAATLVSPG